MFLTALIIGGTVGLAIAALILTSACSLVRVQPPDFFFAMMLSFMVATVVLVLQIVAGVVGTMQAGIDLGSVRTALDYQALLERGLVLGVLSAPFVSAGIYSAALRDCSYRRGLLIWVAQLVVIVLFCLAIWALVSALGLSAKH